MSEKQCKIEGCEKKVNARGLCSMHYARDRKETQDKQCAVVGCVKPLYAKSFCRNHYALNQRNGSPTYKKHYTEECSVLGCNKQAKVLGFCLFHYSRHRRNVPMDRPKGVSGELNPRWNGGTSQYKNHYELKKNRKIALKRDNYICQYCKKKTNQVHHRDHKKDNHGVENLIACCQSCNLKLAWMKIEELRENVNHGN